MTQDERSQLAGLIAWRKGVVPVLKGIPRLIQRITDLEQQVAKLSGKTAPKSKAATLGPKPKKDDRVPFAAKGEEIEAAFEKVFRAALPDDQGVEEWNATDLSKRLGLKYSAETMGRALREMGVLQVQTKRRGKSVRLYRVVVL